MLESFQTQNNPKCVSGFVTKDGNSFTAYTPNRGSSEWLCVSYHKLQHTEVSSPAHHTTAVKAAWAGDAQDRGAPSAACSQPWKIKTC